MQTAASEKTTLSNRGAAPHLALITVQLSSYLAHLGQDGLTLTLQY